MLASGDAQKELVRSAPLWALKIGWGALEGIPGDRWDPAPPLPVLRRAGRGRWQQADRELDTEDRPPVLGGSRVLTAPEASGEGNRAAGAAEVLRCKVRGPAEPHVLPKDGRLKGRGRSYEVVPRGTARCPRSPTWSRAGGRALSWHCPRGGRPGGGAAPEWWSS